MNWLQKLQARWKLGSVWQVAAILLVFACTGFTVVWIARPVLHWFFYPAPVPLWGKVIYYILIFPVYNLILLTYGFIFGQFRFFYEYEKHFLGRIFSKRQSKN